MVDAPTFTLRARNFRALKNVEWSPTGVCLLTGPNGSGKTTLLYALKFLRGVFTQGIESALGLVRGASFLKTRRAATETPVHFELQLGDVCWTLDLPVDARGLISNYGETLVHGDEVVLRADMYQQEWSFGSERRKFDGRRCCSRWVWDHAEPEWMRGLVELVQSIRIYESYWLNQVREIGQPGEHQTYLHPTGRNLWTVLRAWRSSPRSHRDQFAWVMNSIRRAFPEVVGDLEFEGQAPHGIVFPPGAVGPDDGVPAFLEADGVLTGLMHLTAVAGAPEGGILGFDEVENQLHPFAIRSIVESMREMAEMRKLTIVLTTHSPVLLNSFDELENHIFVLDRGAVSQPSRLSDLFDAAWFTAFPLGRRYERGDFGAPPRPTKV